MTVPTAAFDYAQAAGQRQARAAVKDGQMAGFAILTAQPGCLLLDNVAVLPAAQGRGIGAWLLALAKEQARGIGLGETWFCTNEGMTENLAYYTRHGYAGAYRAEQDGFRRVFLRKPIDGPPDSPAEADIHPKGGSEWLSRPVSRSSCRVRSDGRRQAEALPPCLPALMAHAELPVWDPMAASYVYNWQPAKPPDPIWSTFRAR